MSNFRYKWSVGKHCDTDMSETKDHFEFSLPKHFMVHDPINKKVKSWEWTRISRNIFLLHPSIIVPSQLSKREYKEMRGIIGTLL